MGRKIKSLPDAGCVCCRVGGNGQLLAGFPREMRESNFVCLSGIATICFLFALLVALAYTTVSCN